MEREIWKWVFQELDEEALYDVVQKSGVKIKGFRKIERTMIKNVRTKCIRELLKPYMLNKVKILFQDEYAHDLLHFEQMSKEELMQESLHHEKIVKILICLLLSANVEKRSLCIEIYNLVADEMQTVTTVESEDDQIKILQGLIVGLEEKIKKLEKKISKITVELTSKSQELIEKENETKKYERDIRQSKKDLDIILNERNEYESQVETKEGKIVLLEQEIQEQKKENDRLLSVIKQLEQEIYSVQRKYTSEVAADKLSEPDYRHLIAVVGDVRKHVRLAHPIFSLNQIEELISSRAFETYQYVCVLRFSLPPTILRKLKKTVRSEQLKEFYTIDQFKQWERLL